MHDQRMQCTKADALLPELRDRVTRRIDRAERGLQLLRMTIAVKEL